MSLKNFYFILVKPQLGENIGASARALKNFGFSKLSIVKPRDGWPNVKAKATSVGAYEILKKAKMFDSTSEAVEDFDLILAMDWDNLALLQRMAPRGTGHKLHLLMRYATNTEAAIVPDPYDGSIKGFDIALNYIEDACEGLVETICRKASINAAA